MELFRDKLHFRSNKFLFILNIYDNEMEILSLLDGKGWEFKMNKKVFPS